MQFPNWIKWIFVLLGIGGLFLLFCLSGKNQKVKNQLDRMIKLLAEQASTKDKINQSNQNITLSDDKLKQEQVKLKEIQKQKQSIKKNLSSKEIEDYWSKE